ncbi:unnamed protein product [Durusdinium trenchii]|uniref:Uncharacterized protein n=1 Tax=Durusdinium trenchii TaxID=1381693 RepID=A0ABP0NQG5_9DINO
MPWRRRSGWLLTLAALAAGCTEDSCEEDWVLDQLVDAESESELLDVRLLQTQFTQHRGPVKQEEPVQSDHVMSVDHNGKVCMLCNQPLPERITRPYEAFRKDCGKYSSPSGPSLDIMALPAVQLGGGAAEGFCALNFAKSCADAVANQVPRIGPRVGGARRRCPLGSVSVAGDEEEISVPNTARTGFTVDFDVRQGSLRKSFSRLWVSLFEPMMQTKRRGWRVDSEVPRCSPSRAPMSISKNGLGMARDFLQ